MHLSVLSAFFLPFALSSALVSDPAHRKPGPFHLPPDPLTPLPSVSQVAPSYPSTPERSHIVRPLLRSLSLCRLTAFLNEYTSFHTRYYLSSSGARASQYLFSTVKFRRGRLPWKVSTVPHPNFNQTSVIASLPGRSRSAATVIIGAHLDSINGADHYGRSPGADDNGSGTAALLEAFTVLSEQKGFRPKNTVEFHWYAGEEGGLLGSRDIFGKYAKEGREVKAMLNIDMAGYTTQDAISVVRGYVDEGLSVFIEKLVRGYTGCKPVSDLCPYQCSDHASANVTGYPSAFVFEDQFNASTPYGHTVNDTMANLNMSHVFEFSKLALGYVIEASYF